MSKYTHGPWRVVERMDIRRLEIRGAADVHVALAMFLPDGKKRTHLHNARLIAAAPELLQACKALLVEIYEEYHLGDAQSPVEMFARKVIAKAEGR